VLSFTHDMTKQRAEGLLPPLLSIKQVAEATGFHDRTIRRYVYGGILPAVRFGPRCLRIKREDVLKLLTPLGAHDAPKAS
jgi:excisionase family DNA binding protein